MMLRTEFTIAGEKINASNEITIRANGCAYRRCENEDAWEIVSEDYQVGDQITLNRYHEMEIKMVTDKNMKEMSQEKKADETMNNVTISEEQYQQLIESLILLNSYLDDDYSPAAKIRIGK